MNTDANTPSSASTSEPEPVASVSVKLPPFWPNDLLVWFAQVEAHFFTRNITSQATKFAYVISALQPEFAQEGMRHFDGKHQMRGAFHLKKSLKIRKKTESPLDIQKSLQIFL